MPKTKTFKALSLKSGGQPSPHVVDLRSSLAGRAANLSEAKARKPSNGLATVSVPRTISENPDRRPVWTAQALVAFGGFLYAIGKGIIMALGKLVAWPLMIGLAVVERFDPDKRQAIEPASSAPAAAAQPAPQTAAEAEAIFSQPAEAPKPAPRAHRQFSLRRSLVSFAGASLAVILPLQGLNTVRALLTLKNQAEEAKAASLAALSGSSSLADAQEAIGAARQTVAGLGEVGNALLDRVPKLGGEFRSGKALLEAGDDLSSAAALLGKSFGFLDDQSLNVTDKIAKAQELAGRAEPLLAAASKALDSADQLPDQVQGDIVSLRDQVRSMDELTASFLAAAPALRSILGEQQARRYLIIFQNNAELRPTGGFIGSFAVADIDRGAVKAVEVPAGGSYDLQGSLKASVLAPEPLRLVSARWQFQDANWFPDFPTSAKKIAWFYQQSAGATVDGVIAVNAPLLAKLLDAVGPISMPEYKTIATGTTVLRTAQEIVESDEARQGGKPKQFIADLLPRVLSKVMEAKGDDAVSILKTLSQALESKDIQAYFADAGSQAAFAKLGWTGELAPVPAGFDSFGLVRANIAGAKTDAVMKTDIRHQISVAADGRVTDHVAVTLTHGGQKGDPFTGVRNVTYLRVYAPQGSKLVAASGDIRPPAYSFFDIPPVGCAPDQTLMEVSGATYHDATGSVAVNDEFGRTAFGAWTQTDPGNSSTVTFDYELPFAVTPSAAAPTPAQKIGLAARAPESAAFGLVIDKQSGAENTQISSSLKLPAGWYPSLASPAGIAQTDGWTYTSDLSADRALGIVISR